MVKDRFSSAPTSKEGKLEDDYFDYFYDQPVAFLEPWQSLLMPAPRHYFDRLQRS